MSYEGYTQNICKNGHYFVNDALEAFGCNNPCPVCGSKSEWVNEVDSTNCDSYGFIFMEQFRVKSEEYHKCGCGHVHRHFLEESIYRIPSEEETRRARTVRTSDGKIVPLEE